MSKSHLFSQFYLLFFIFSLSCNGQNTSIQSSTESNVTKETTALGDTITEFDKKSWIVFQDRDSTYWFGTNGNGLYRYDGNTLLHFTTNHGLLNDDIRGIQEDHSGNIFITSIEGVSKFDGKKFSTLPIVESNEWKLDSNDLWFSILGKTGEDGPYRYDGNKLHHLKFPKSYMEDAYYAANGKRSWSPYEPYTIYKDSKGTLWFGTAELGVCRYDGKSIGWMYEEHLTLIEGGGSFGIRSILEDKEGNFWICNTKYRYKMLSNDLNDNDNNRIHYKREKGIDNARSPEGKDRIYFMSAVEDDEGNLWMLTYEQGVWRYDGENITQYSVKDGDQEAKLFSIYKDKHGNLWLGSHASGLFKFNGTSFEKFKG